MNTASTPTVRTGLNVLDLLLLIVGVLGNSLVLLKLAKKSTNGYYTMLMLLKCLMANNLMALMGILTMLILQSSLPKYLIEPYSHWFCACWVIFRFFGVCSGCIAVFMAIERYLAICHIFFHRVHLTRSLTKNVIIGLIFLGALITFLPLFGFGIYVDEGTKKCIRYRDVKTLSDRAYALLMLCFGTLICIIIVTFNTFVIIGLHNHMRRKMEFFCDSSSNLLNPQTLPPIEIKYCKVMVLLDLSFVLCWMPEMICIFIALTSLLPEKHWFYRLADALMVLHFVLDPYIYMLRKRTLELFSSIMQWSKSCMRSRPASNTITNPVEDCNNTIH